MMIGIFSEIVGTVQFNVGNVTGELLFIYLELFWKTKLTEISGEPADSGKYL